ncbi:unnamed protein product, partial [Amoebophrya sp. A25]
AKGTNDDDESSLPCGSWLAVTGSAVFAILVICMLVWLYCSVISGGQNKVADDEDNLRSSATKQGYGAVDGYSSSSSDQEGAGLQSSFVNVPTTVPTSL